MTTEIGSLDVILSAVGALLAAPGCRKDSQMPVPDAPCREDLHCEIAPCNVRELNLFFHILFI